MDSILKDDVPKVRILCSQRWLLAILACLGNMVIYMTRVNLSVAIICMVRSDDDVIETNVTSVSTYNVTDMPSGVDDGCGGSLDVTKGGGPSDSGEFTWDKGTRSGLLSMYFYGYIFTQIPGGWLSLKFGGKRVWGICMLFGSLCSLLTPVSARTNVYFTYFLRFVLGFTSGVTFPCVHSLLGRWTPPFERSKLAVYTFAGPLLGNILTFAVSGYLCEYGFDNGWGSIFYLSGIINLVWVIMWFIFTADSPDKHPRISQKELNYITHSIGKGAVHNNTRKVPWLAMFKSGPVWAIMIAHFGNNYTNYTLLTSLPSFMKESLKFDIKQNGLLSAMPYVTQLVSSALVGVLADTVREKRWLSTKTVRKIVQVSSFIGVAVCATFVGRMDCSQRYIAVFILCSCTGFLGFSRAGYIVNHLDLAPTYAGILFGISNTFATIPGMIAPIVAGALTPNKSAEEWCNVFYVCAAVAIVCAILYMWLADGELQTWANPDFFKVKASTTEITVVAVPMETVDDVMKPLTLGDPDGNVESPDDSNVEVKAVSPDDVDGDKDADNK